MSLKDEWRDYELVMVCLNPLPDWNDGASIRAFQTYMFDDVTTSGDEPLFKHSETGTDIRYDGTEIAITYGYGNLFDVFIDLIRALHSLGWREAEVYHKQDTMNALLSDIGRAVPANMDFEVRPAQLNKPIAEYPEARQLIEHTAQVMKPDGAPAAMEDTEEATIKAGFLSLMDDPATPSLPASLPASRVVAVSLIDDDPMVPTDNDELLFPAKNSIAPTRPMQQFADEEPAVFDLPEEGNGTLPESASFDEYPEPDVPSTEPMTPASTIQASDETTVEDGQETVENEHQLSLPEKHAAPPKESSIPSKIDVSNEKREIVIMDCAEMPVVPGLSDKMARVGHSVFCFDLPESPFTAADMQLIVNEFNIYGDQIIHLHPGKLKEPVRWDVFGEIDLNYPWFAEIMANEMQLPLKNINIVATLLLALKKLKPAPELRDLLMFASASEMVEVSASVSNTALSLMKHFHQYGDLSDGFIQNGIINAIVTKLGALALAPTGESFVDLMDGEKYAESVVDTFSVLETARSSTAKVFVVHVDVLDGPFVVWLTQYLRAIAQKYGAGYRYRSVEPVFMADHSVETVEQVMEPQPEVVNAEVTKAVTTLLEQLKKLGVTLPA